jgi:hypothetical protein
VAASEEEEEEAGRPVVPQVRSNQRGRCDVQQAARWRSVRVAVLALFVCLFGFDPSATATDTTDSCILWGESTPLTWDLFQAVPPADAVHRNEAAAIHMTIRWHAVYSVTSNGGSWTGHVKTATVTNAMEPALSWVVPGKAAPLVLRHEQGHFDLNEVYRRKLELSLACLRAQSATKDGAIDTLNTALHNRANEILAQLQAAQARYDAETGHGNNAAGQVQWATLIARWLLDPAAAP